MHESRIDRQVPITYIHPISADWMRCAEEVMAGKRVGSELVSLTKRDGERS